jgi:hypothetical protein
MLPGRHRYIWERFLPLVEMTRQRYESAKMSHTSLSKMACHPTITPSLQYSHSIPSRSHIKENRLVLTLQPDIEMIDGLTIPLFSCGDERRSPSFVLDEL